MGRKSSLTPERLAKDINFFEGYVAKCEIAFIAVDDTLVGDFISKYTQDDVIVEPVSINDYIVHFNIYSNGQKQLHSLILKVMWKENRTEPRLTLHKKKCLNDHSTCAPSTASKKTTY